VWVTFKHAPGWLSPDMQTAFFLAWALPLVAWMARTAFTTTAPRSKRRLAPEREPRAVALAHH
jgi:hypothetical protein